MHAGIYSSLNCSVLPLQRTSWPSWMAWRATRSRKECVRPMPMTWRSGGPILAVARTIGHALYSYIYCIYIYTLHFQRAEWRERTEWHGLHELESKTRPRLKAWSPASTNQLDFLQHCWSSGDDELLAGAAPHSRRPKRAEERRRNRFRVQKDVLGWRCFSGKGLVDWLQIYGVWGSAAAPGMAKTWADIRASEVLNPSQSIVVVRNARSCHSHIAVVSSEYLWQPNGSSWTQPTVVRCTVASHGTESEEGPCAAAHWAERCYLPHRASWEGFCVLGITSWVGRGSPSLGIQPEHGTWGKKFEVFALAAKNDRFKVSNEKGFPI